MFVETGQADINSSADPEDDGDVRIAVNACEQICLVGDCWPSM